MDKFGRVLLPKKLRAALHLQPGGKLRVHVDGERLTLVSEPRQAKLREEGGLLLIETSAQISFDSDPVAEARAARDREILGDWW